MDVDGPGEVEPAGEEGVVQRLEKRVRFDQTNAQEESLPGSAAGTEGQGEVCSTVDALCGSVASLCRLMGAASLGKSMGPAP